MRLRSIAFCVLAGVLALSAQDKKPADHSGKPKSAGNAANAKPQGMPEGMMTKQAAEMQKAIKAMQGTWSTKAVFEKSDFMPNGGTANGTATFKPGPGGLSMQQDYHSTGAMGDFRGLSIVWFDPKDQMFHSLWCDGMTPSGCTDSGTGKWDGDKIVINAKSEFAGKSFDMRSTIGPFNGNTFTYAEEMGENGQFKPSMTITYTKKAGGAAPAKAKPTGKG
jgi:hypothetical protein